jgi:hypothetical protein
MLFMAIVICSGCNKVISLREIKKLYPNAEMQPVPGQSYQWIIYNSNNILWVEYRGVYELNTNDVIVLFKIK